MTVLYFLSLAILTVYSFALIDPNITFFQTRWWEVFREKIIYFGYYQRNISWLIYLFLIILLFVFHYFFIKKYRQFNPILIAIFTGSILLISYPLLSHDFFNYMFDARILTYHQQNPYLFKALDFPSDPWLRFLQWTHRTYPYGPVFLLITLIPSFLSIGKFVLGFLFFKLTFMIFYILGVFYLNKINKKYALIFATHPLIIIEGLVNTHNDLIAAAIGLCAVFYLLDGKNIKSRILFLLSAGIKYLTAPVLLLRNQKSNWNTFVFAVTLGIIFYLCVKSEIQAWYFLNLFIFIPFLIGTIQQLDIFFFGLLLSYYPYIRLGGWDTAEKIAIKHWIIVLAAILNILFLLFPWKKIIFKEVKQ